MSDPILDTCADAIGEFPLDGPPEAQLRAAVSFAVQAPSGHNSQPWVFRIHDDALDLSADRTRALPVVDPEDRELVISCGAALFNIRLALRRFCRNAEVAILPDPDAPDLLARIRVGATCQPTEDDQALFGAIPRRRTYRHPFDDRAVPEPVVTALTRAAAQESAWLRPVRSITERDALVDAVAEGDRRQMADRSFRRELALWLHPDRAKSRDGMPGSAVGLKALMSVVGPLAIRTFDMGRGRAAWDRELAQKSPVLAVLGTRGDTVTDWLVAGQALQRVLLRACAEGVYASFLNQPVEVPALRGKVRALLGEPGQPQMVMRLGYGHAGRRAPRRDVQDILR